MFSKKLVLQENNNCSFSPILRLLTRSSWLVSTIFYRQVTFQNCLLKKTKTKSAAKFVQKRNRHKLLTILMTSGTSSSTKLPRTCICVYVSHRLVRNSASVLASSLLWLTQLKLTGSTSGPRMRLLMLLTVSWRPLICPATRWEIVLQETWLSCICQLVQQMSSSSWRSDVSTTRHQHLTLSWSHSTKSYLARSKANLIRWSTDLRTVSELWLEPWIRSMNSRNSSIRRWSLLAKRKSQLKSLSTKSSTRRN